MVIHNIPCIGGESAWGEPFKDEFKPNLIHQGEFIKIVFCFTTINKTAD